MASNKLTMTVAILFFLLIMPAQATRMYDRRSDLTNLPPLLTYGFTVPLQGGLTCPEQDDCTSTLTPSTSDKILKVLAIGRGLLNYSCVDIDSTDTPVFEAQLTELFDAGPLTTAYGGEELLHSLVPEFLHYNYGQMKNSTLKCIGSIETVDNAAVVALSGIGTFEAYLLESINPPANPNFNGMWEHYISDDDDWEFYRVETTGGAAPSTCVDISGTFEVEYAAEYWFYHI